MRLIQKLSLTTLSLSMLGAVVSSPIVANADSKSQYSYSENRSISNHNHTTSSFNQGFNSKLNTDVLNKYVHVKNNQFVLNLPNNIKISDDLKKLALSEISFTNSIIKTNKLTIDPTTLTATRDFNVDDNGNISFDNDGLSFRSYGRTGVLKYGWNYVRIGFDASLTKDIVAGGVAGAAGALTFVAEGPGTAATVAAVAAVVGNHIHFKRGTYIDYNFFLKRIVRAGWQ